MERQDEIECQNYDFTETSRYLVGKIAKTENLYRKIQFFCINRDHFL